jgi:hypothetical protein
LRSYRLIALISTALFATSAEANWQYTKWGMTPAQVITASHGAVGWRPVKNPKADGRANEVGGSYIADNRTFDVSFDFRNGRLSSVALETDMCATLLPDLETKYGEPQILADGSFPEWRWRDKIRNDDVVLFGLLGNCLLAYSPHTNAAKGL